jgi:hypothetical protein
VDFVVTFNPQFEQLYTLTAYCDVQGKEKRIPILLKGQGLPPKVQTSFDMLGILVLVDGNIYDLQWYCKISNGSSFYTSLNEV